MPLRYLLDTNAVSELIRHPAGTVAQRIAAEGEETVCTSIIVAAELRFGAAKSHSRQIVERVDLILAALEVLPLEAPVDVHYGEIRHHLASQGSQIGPNDLLIAAHARALDLVIVTANAREFSRVPRAKVENWLAS